MLNTDTSATARANARCLPTGGNGAGRRRGPCRISLTASHALHA